MRRISRPAASRNRVLSGYAAFNEGDWTTLQKLLCQDVVWHPMDGGGAIKGQDRVMAHLKELRDTTVAELCGIAMTTQGDAAITVDFTRTSRKEGDHACADKIVFDGSGCIKEVWHCAVDTHQHGHAGHPLGADGKPHQHT
jgi:ketosteroid isomerase-like protein